jgi:hypothetical protein
MDTGQKRLYDPGQAPVYSLPDSDPMRALADWGAPPSPPSQPYRIDDERSYLSPGTPPWEPEPAGPAPVWAWTFLVAGCVLLAGAAVAISALYG